MGENTYDRGKFARVERTLDTDGLLQRPKPQKMRLRSRETKAKLHRAFTMVPVRALRFAYNYAMPTVEVCTQKRKAEFDKVIRRTKETIKPLQALGKDENGYQDPMDVYRQLRAAAALYTNIFYSLEREELIAYLSLCNERGVWNRRPTEENILLYPAAMALKGKPRAQVKKEILVGLYKKPFRLMHDFSRDAIRIDMFKQSISIKSIPEGTLDSIRKGVASLSARIAAIEKFEIRPSDDDQFRMGFIDQIVEMTINSDLCIAHYMEERLDHSKSYDRIMRS
jgi:hypothetical protein